MAEERKARSRRPVPEEGTAGSVVKSGVAGAARTPTVSRGLRSLVPLLGIRACRPLLYLLALMMWAGDVQVSQCSLSVNGPECQAKASTSAGQPGIELFSRNYALEFPNGDEFHLKGLNWFGAETDIATVHGLWAQSVDHFLDFLTQHKFNAVRLPLSVDNVLSSNPPVYPPDYDYLSCFFDGTITTMQSIDYIIARLAERGILVLLDQHRLNTGSISECYTDADHDESVIIQFWDALIDRYASTWNVMGVDLKNEPYGCWWRDWVDFATRMGNHILEKVPRWLVFVNGIGENVNAIDRTCVTCTEGSFWGENMVGACNYPVEFNTTEKLEKLVYSPHVYGPSVYGQDYFDPFPGDTSHIPAIWDCHFGFLHTRQNDTDAPNSKYKNAVIIGEWGGLYTDTNKKGGTYDKTWQNAYAEWHNASGLPGTFYWCLNKNSGDTGGLLSGQDWSAQETEKLALPENLHPNPTFISSNDTYYCYQDWDSLVATPTYSTWPCGENTEPSAAPSVSESPTAYPVAEPSASPSISKAPTSNGCTHFVMVLFLFLVAGDFVH